MILDAERRVRLSYEMVSLSYLSLEDLLRHHGIDPDRPYTQVDLPAEECHLYIQRKPPSREGFPS